MPPKNIIPKRAAAIEVPASEKERMYSVEEKIREKAWSIFLWGLLLIALALVNFGVKIKNSPDAGYVRTDTAGRVAKTENLATPIYGDTEVRQFVTDAFRRIFTFNRDDMDLRQADAMEWFTDAGYRRYTAMIKDSQLDKFVNMQGVQSKTELVEVPELSPENQGIGTANGQQRYYWLVRVKTKRIFYWPGNTGSTRTAHREDVEYEVTVTREEAAVTWRRIGIADIKQVVAKK